MPIPTLERLQAKDAELRRVIDKIATFANAVKGVEILHGRRLESVELVTSAPGNKVAHGLGRKPVGWFVTLRANNAALWDAAPPDVDFLYIGAPTGVVVDIWVF